MVDASELGGYYIDYRAKVHTHLRYPGQGLPPAPLAQLALGWHERGLYGDQDAESAFLGVCEELASSAVPVDAGLVWPYEVPVVKYPLARPWYSGMAQGQIASAFVRAWQRTGDDRYAEWALKAVEPLLEPSFAELVTRTPRGPVIQECGPMQPRAHILNGWIFGLWGARDVSVALGDARMGRLAAETTVALAASVALYDTGWWTRYSLYPHVLPDLAKPFYHRLHVVQMEVMRDLTGAAEFASAAARWKSYDTSLAAMRAIASKVPFVLTKRVRARARRSGNA
jgi:heparosan-N-sulfate-glucuronate 5-epimerase